MKLATITTTLMTSLLVACGDGVTIGDQNPAVANDAPAVQSPFAVSTPADNPAGVNNPTGEQEPNAPDNGELAETPAPETITLPIGEETAQTPAPETINTPISEQTAQSTPEPIARAQFGFVDAQQSVGSPITFVDGSFTDYFNLSPRQLNNVLAIPDVDTCLVDVFGQRTEEVEIDIEATQPTSRDISAGEVLVLTSPEGTFTELPREISDDRISYSAPPQGWVTSGLPTSLTLDIPGDEFPAFSNVDIPVIQPFNLLSPIQDEFVNADTEFSWTAGNNPDAYIQFSGFGDNDENRVFALCTMRDDGSFSFSPSTINEMGPGIEFQRFSVGRQVRATYVDGISTLIVSTGSYLSIF